MTEEIIGGGENGKVHNEEVKPDNPQDPQPAPTDFKVAEIWIKDGQLFLQATEEFWKDKIRALGMIELCKDIIKNAKVDKPKIITAPPKGSLMNFLRSGLKKRR